MSTIEENKNVLRRYYDEALNGKNLEVIHEVFASNVISHGKEINDKGNDDGPYVSGTWGADQEKRLRKRQLAQFPDATVHYDLVAEGDMVASRWSVTFSAKESGHKTEMPLRYFYRFEDRKVVEMWYMW